MQKTNFRQIKKLIDRLEKKEKELASYKAKVKKLEEEVTELKNELATLLNNTQPQQTTTNTLQ